MDRKELHEFVEEIRREKTRIDASPMKWRKVTKELPTEDGWYIVSEKRLGGSDVCTMAWFSTKYREWESYEDYVYAWMPFPEPCIIPKPNEEFLKKLKEAEELIDMRGDRDE